MSDGHNPTGPMVEPEEFLRLFPCEVSAWGRPTGERKLGADGFFKEQWDYSGRHRKPEAQDARLHFEGRVSIVANPVVQLETGKQKAPVVKWVALESDNYDPGFVGALEKKVRELMPFAMTDRSKSGGLHVFVLLSEWVPFAQAKALLDGFVALLGLPPKTEVFPSKPWTSADKGLGINLPGFGGGGLRRDLVRRYEVVPWPYDTPVPGEAPKAASASGGERRRPTADGFDVEDWLRFQGISFRKRGEDKYELDSCPRIGKPHVTQNSSTTVFYFDGKGMGWKCQADQCRESTVSDAVSAAEERRPYGLPVWRASYPLTDSGNAERFADEHSGEFRYIEDKKTWVSWDGSRWSKDSMWKVHQAGKDTIREMYAEFSKIADEDRRKKAVGWALKSESQHGRNAIVALAEKEPGIVASSAEFDQDPLLLNVANGTLDLRPRFSGGGLSLMPLFRQARKEDMMTKTCPMPFDPEADCPRFKRFLGELFADLGAEQKADAVHSLQRAFAYSMLGTADEQCFFLLWGPGDNGKSLLLKVIAHVLGDYSVGTSFDVFLAKRSESKAIDPRSGLFELIGSRYVWASESDQGARFSEALIKAVTGGEEMKVAKVYEESVTFKPGFKLWLSTNHEPNVRGTDTGIWRRIKRFDITATPKEKDKQLFDKLAAEASGILNWLLEGVMLFHAWQPVGGLRIPKTSEDAVKKYRADQNAVLRFVVEVCLPTDDEREAVPARSMYEAYKAWAKQTREYELAERLFGPEMDKLAKANGFEHRKFSSGPHKGKQGYFGIKINPDFFNE